MAEKVVYRIKGHEKFILREGWLNKGLKAFENNNRVFSSKQANDLLGVGTNMAKSIKYWLQATGMIIKNPNKKTEEVLSEDAKVILRYDPYIEDIFTLWMLHSNLAKNRNLATSWYMFFNKFEAESFEKKTAITKVWNEINNFVGTELKENAVKDDLDILLNMYTKRPNKIDDPEDKNVCPFSELGLLKKNNELYVKVQPDLRKLNDHVVMRELCCMSAHEQSLSIEQISHGDHGLAKIYHLSNVEINRFLDKIETLGFIKVDRTAGLDVVYFKEMPNPREVMEMYYKKQGRGQ